MTAKQLSPRTLQRLGNRAARDILIQAVEEIRGHGLPPPFHRQVAVHRRRRGAGSSRVGEAAKAQSCIAGVEGGILTKTRGALHLHGRDRRRQLPSRSDQQAGHHDVLALHGELPLNRRQQETNFKRDCELRGGAGHRRASSPARRMNAADRLDWWWPSFVSGHYRGRG